MKQHSVRKRVIGGFFAVLLLAAGVFGYMVYAEANAVTSTVAKSGSVTDLLKAEALNGETSGVVNILIAGNSSDDAGHAGMSLTDSLMVVHYDMTAKTATLISIPRDLYVSSSGDYMKINAVYTNGGMDELQTVVEEVTGLNIDHHVLINYTAFKQIVNAVGGVDVTINASDARGIYDPMTNFSIANGVQHLDGTQALALARARNDPTYDGRIAYGLPNGDFDRAANQRLIVQALLTKINLSQTLLNPSTILALVNSLSGNVSSDFTVGQIRRLYDLSKQVATTQSISLRGTDTNVLLTDYSSYTSGAALVPVNGFDDYEAIQSYITATITPSEQST